MKILVLTDWFPPYVSGGAEQVVENIVKNLKKRNHQVFVITTVQKKDDVENKDGVHRIYIPDYHLRWKAYKGLYNSVAVKQLTKLIKEIKPDVVHAHNIHTYLSYNSLKIAKKYCQKVFLSAHDVQSFHYGKLTELINQQDLSVPQSFNYKVSPWQQIKRFKKRYNPLRNAIIKHYLKYVDKIFAVSSALQEALKQNGIINTEVVHNGININDWQLNTEAVAKFKKDHHLENKKVVFFGGRLSALKGGQNILHAMATVVKSIPEAVLLVVGDDKSIESITTEAKQKGIPLVTTGWLSGSQLVTAYWSSDVVVVPSICFDSFPTVNLEAMACQRPIIATCFGGSSELVVDNKTGFIVNPLDINNLAQQILLLLTDRKLAEQFGNSAIMRVKEQFSIDRQVDKFLTFFNK